MRVPFPVAVADLPWRDRPATLWLVRSFGRPSGLTDASRVSLIWTSGDVPADVRLPAVVEPARTVAPHEPATWELPHPLPWRSQLVARIDLSSIDGIRSPATGDSRRLIGDCCIVIEETDQVR